MLRRTVQSAGAWLRGPSARSLHSSPASTQVVNGEDATVAPQVEFFAVERTSPVVHTRLSYLDPSKKPKNSQNAQLVPLSSHVFQAPPHQHAMHLATVYYLDALRSGTASTKTRSEVAFSGRRIRPQKGTGRARLSDAGNPMLRKGGVAHGPRPRDFATDLPRKVRELALRSALSARLREGRLHIVPSLAWIPPPTSTNRLARLLNQKAWNHALFLSAPRDPTQPAQGHRAESRPSSRDLIYTEEQLANHKHYLRNFAMAARNLPQVELLQLQQLPPHIRPRADHAKKPGELHAYQVLQYPRIIMDLGALEWLEEKLGGSAVQELYAEELQQLISTQPPRKDKSESESTPPSSDGNSSPSTTGVATDAATFSIADALSS
ncbi:54S ribosomal protein yml6, mitochondrial [Malassezia psittaci]|uniref:Large ribosomal subunit protein uL4m n=1 Tax=Malassezia psittaci TaxID=1821823 RepID=A0AAF0F6W8_9BASI|nr:54S ribosomal protein yml6, mitochondrial [Malassezia psittaci]